VEYQGCILTGLRICQDGKKLPVGFGQNIQMDEDVCLLGNDPAAYANIGPGEVEVNVRMVLPGAEYDRIMQQHMVNLQDYKIQANARQRELLSQIAQREHQIAQCEYQIGQCEYQIAQLQADLRDYMILAEQKEKYILAMKLRTTPMGILRYLFPRVFRVAKSLARRILGILGRRSANG
jgi:hypothetical protein